MPPGGARPGAGRPRGRKSGKTLALLDAVATQGLTPLEYLLNLLRDEQLERAVRLDAAKAAAPYVHPRLAQIDTTLKGDEKHPIVLSQTDGRL